MDAAARQASFKGRKKFFICFTFKMNPIKEQNYKKSANDTLFQANKFARGSKYIPRAPRTTRFPGINCYFCME